MVQVVKSVAIVRSFATIRLLSEMRCPVIFSCPASPILRAADRTGCSVVKRHCGHEQLWRLHGQGQPTSARLACGKNSLCINPLKPNDHFSRRTAPLNSKRCILYIFIQQIQVPIILNVEILSVFFSSKWRLFHNSNVLGSCIVQILYIYSTNIGTEYFKHGIYFPFFPLQNAVCFIVLTFLVPVLFTFYIFIQQIQVPNILNMVYTLRFFLFKMQFVSQF